MSNPGVKIEVHLIQNFAPSNLNRDDTGQPKSASFGGFRRARVSSQCMKRSTRREEPMAQLLERGGALRTRQLITEVARLVEGTEVPGTATVDTVASVFEAGGIERRTREGDNADADSRSTTSILLYVDKESLPQLAAVFKANWRDLTEGKKEAQDEAQQRVGEILFEAVRAPDIALFGRMLELKSTTPFGKYNMRVEAACQVAHPISTHKVDMEMDYYTAVDDLNPAEETGAAMIGVTGFDSACYYRYALVDRDQLARNLTRKTGRRNGEWIQSLGQSDYSEADAVIKAFLEAFVHAIPSGKQNAFAAQNLPSFGLFVRRHGGVPISLANAFAKPVRPGKTDDDLVGLSVDALTTYWDETRRVYGDLGIETTACFHIGCKDRLNKLADSDRGTVEKAIDAVVEPAERR